MLIKSALLGDIRGSVGSLTFSRNPSGNYARLRTKPVNPNTALQQAVRLRMQVATAAWTTDLTQVQRDAWGVYAANVPVLNRLGDTINISGFAMYVRSSTVSQAAGLTVVNDGPTDFTLPQADGLFAATISEATQLISVVFGAGDGWKDEDEAALVVSMSIPQGAGRTFLNPRKRQAGIILGDSVTAPTSPTTMAVPFAVAETQKVIVSARITRADGRVSNPFLVTASIAS